MVASALALAASQRSRAAARPRSSFVGSTVRRGEKVSPAPRSRCRCRWPDRRAGRRRASSPRARARPPPDARWRRPTLARRPGCPTCRRRSAARRWDSRCPPRKPRPDRRPGGPLLRVRLARPRAGPSHGSARPGCPGHRSPTQAYPTREEPAQTTRHPNFSHSAAMVADSSAEVMRPGRRAAIRRSCRPRA